MIHTIFHKSLYGDLGDIDINSCDDDKVMVINLKNTIYDYSLYSNEIIYDDYMDYNIDNPVEYIIFLV